MSDPSTVAVVNGQLLASNEIDFGDLTPIEVPVRVQGKRYILREPSGAAVKSWQRLALLGTEMTFDDNSGTRIMRNFSGVAGNEAMLISQCLYMPDAEGKIILLDSGDADPRQLVPERKIDFWPHRIKKGLFEKLEEMCPELSANETLEFLIKQRDKIDQKIKKLEDSSPKKL